MSRLEGNSGRKQETPATERLVITDARIIASKKFLADFPPRLADQHEGVEKNQSPAKVEALYLSCRERAKGSNGQEVVAEGALSHHEWQKIFLQDKKQGTSDWEFAWTRITIEDYTDPWKKVEFKTKSGQAPLLMKITLFDKTLHTGLSTDVRRWCVFVDDGELAMALKAEDDPANLNRWCSDKEIEGVQRLLDVYYH